MQIHIVEVSKIRTQISTGRSEYCNDNVNKKFSYFHRLIKFLTYNLRYHSLHDKYTFVRDQNKAKQNLL